MADGTGTSGLEVFCSFASQDETLCKMLLDQLKPLERQGSITCWHRGLMLSGSEEAREVERHLESARLILLLLSPSYVASDDCAAEMARALERKRAGAAHVLPILLRPVDLELLPFRALEVLPSSSKPVTSWPAPYDEGFQEVTRGIRRVLEQEQAQPALVDSTTTLLWNIPYGRNPLFTGREEVLEELHEQLTRQQKASLTQAQAISGLGGIGKTQTAIEYAYRHREQYRYVLWVSAASQETLSTSFLELAALLHVPEQPDQARMIAAVKTWFAAHDGWLVIFDNADDLALVEDYLPPGSRGHLLLTTRAQVPGVLAHGIEVEQLDEEQGVSFLLRRAGILGTDAPLEQALEADRQAARALVRELGGLPLALDQAGAYIEETRCTLASYLKRYQERQASLLKRRGGTGKQHPEPVAATWSLSFARVEALDPLAADLLRVCAFLAPDAIPERMLLDGASELGEHLAPLDEDVALLDEAVAALLRFSLLKRKRDEATLSVHRLVQAVLRASMDEATQRLWAERVMRAVARAFPHGWDYSNWPHCQQELPHAQACFNLIEQWAFTLPEAARLCNAVGSYLQRRGQYPEAEAFFLRAIAIGEQALGSENPNLADYYGNLALLYQYQGRYQEAEPLFQRAIAIAEKVLDSEHPDLATFYNALALLYQYQGRYQEAEPLYQRAIAIGEKALGPEHPNLTACYSNLANLYYHQRRYQEAEPLYHRAIAIGEKTLGPEHPELATRYNNLALLYSEQGRYQEAEPLYRRAIATGEKTLGRDHPELATYSNNLAFLYETQGQYPEAEAFFQRALAIRERVFGPEHRFTVQVRQYLLNAQRQRHQHGT